MRNILNAAKGRAEAVAHQSHTLCEKCFLRFQLIKKHLDTKCCKNMIEIRTRIFLIPIDDI